MTGPFHYSSIVFCDQTNFSSSVSFYPLVFVSDIIIIFVSLVGMLPSSGADMSRTEC